MEKVGIDTVVFIYLLEENQQYYRKAERVLQAIESGENSGVFSCIGMIELLTGPKKTGRYEIAARYREIISNFPNLTISGVNENIIELASNLRAQYNIAMPDCLHIASAIDFGAAKFITNDKTLKRIKEINVELL